MTLWQLQKRNYVVRFPGVRLHPMAMMELLMPLFDYYKKFLVSLYYISTIFVFNMVVYHKPGPTSTIIPIPKPGTAKFRPISLTSCFCKVMERIVGSRLMYRFHDRLCPFLFGFLPQRSTHHCLVDLYSRLSFDGFGAI